MTENGVAAWRSLATAVLRKVGHPAPDEPALALGTTTYDGIAVAPLYTARDAAFTRAGVTRGRWEVRQQHAGPDPDRCAEEAGRDVEGGVDSLWFRIGDAGLPPAALPAVLARLDLRQVGVVLDAGRHIDAAFAGLMTAAERASVPPEALTGNLGLDPLAGQARAAFAAELTDCVARTGKATGMALVVEHARRCVTTMPGVRAVTVDATVYHDAGGSDADELGCSVAAGVAHLRAMVEAGIDVGDAFGQLEFRYAATTDQFLTIAKLRAARRLWARIAEVCGAADGRQRQHAVTSSAMMTARDPWTNMLRTTVAAFGAVAGGADALTVQPFDIRLGVPDGHARRIARNTHAVLRDEAGLHRVADPAAGSWYVERLTGDLARRAWDRFTEIESLGGMAAAIERGRVAEALAGTWHRRVLNAATRRDPIIGVSAFPNLGERLPERVAAPEPAGFAPRRPAALFESLRDRTDAHTRRTGTRPAVLLVAVGPAARHAPRVAFAANFFAVAGLATEGVTAEGVTADVAGEAGVVCLCGDDPGDAIVKELRNNGAVRVWHAGQGGAETGADGRLQEGCDVLDVLRTTLDDLKVTR